MCIETIEPNKQQYTLIKSWPRPKKSDAVIAMHNNKPILTTDYDALLVHTAMRAKNAPQFIFTISRVNTME